MLNIESLTGKLNNIELSNGVVKKLDLTSSDPILVTGTSHSNLKEIYPFLTSDYVKEITKEVDGTADTKFDLSINTEGEVTMEQNVDIIISNAHGEKFLDLFNIQGGFFSINIDNDNWKFDGYALANQQQFRLKMNSGSDVINGNLQGKLAVVDIMHFNVMDNSISGDVNVDISSTYIDDYQYIEGKIDITDTVIDMPSVDWVSGVGDPGLIQFTGIKQEESMIITKFTLESDQARIKGTGNIEQSLVTSLNIEEALIANNNIQISYKDAESVTTIIMKGDKLTLSHLGENNNNFNDENFRIIANFKEVVLKNNISTFNVSADIHPQYKDSYITGEFSQSSRFTIENNQDNFILRSNDAGLFMLAIGATDDIMEGKLLIHYSHNDDLGKLILKDFFLTRAPVLTQILSLASLQGIVNTLNHDGISFDQLLAQFTYKNGVATFDESWLEGLSIGISFKGAVDIKTQKMNLSGHVVPLYYINKLIWKIPGIGKLLTGGRGRGIISVDYKLETQEDGENAVSVNMLSVLTPKLLQRVIEILNH